MPWLAVVFGVGVALYFGLRMEPPIWALGLCVLGGMACIVVSIRWPEICGPLGLALAFGLAGVAISGIRTHMVAAPVLDRPYFGPISGRIVAIDRSASDALRLTFDQVQLGDMAADQTPIHVRVSLHGDDLGTPPQPGAHMQVQGFLAPPSGRAEPGGFDFQRHAWFASLGGVGYSRAPLQMQAERQSGEAVLFDLRLRLSAVIQAEIPGQAGAFAAAVLTGDRSGLHADTIAAMRDANIAHLLAISGLHMGLLTGFIYAALRSVLALIPGIALRYPVRKWAAVVALGAGAFYLALSGGNVATERAFVQVAIFFVAVMLDRRAFTLRSVAIAALIVLARRPETLMTPGFQMSFAATAALIGAFGALRHVTWFEPWPKWVRAIAAVVVSSLVAGLATAPFGAAHFNQVAFYGLAANLLTVPLMGAVIIPAAVIAFLTWPLGLSGLAFDVMQAGLNWTLAVSGYVAALPGAVSPVIAPEPVVLALMSLGALFVLLWRGGWRYAGSIAICAGFLIWSDSTRPDVLIADTGRLVGVQTDYGRALSRARGEGFVAGIWLENDGDAVTQADAAARDGWQGDPSGGVRGRLGNITLWHATGREDADQMAGACARYDIIITPATVSELRQANTPPPPPDAVHWPLIMPQDGSCIVMDQQILNRTGAIALMQDGPQIYLTTARAHQGQRPWVQ
jgi:competence protein ComEC